MSERAKKTVRIIYQWLLAFLSVAVGIAFIAQIVSIYRSTPQNPYTVERIEEHFKEIAPLFWAWIVLIAGGGVLFAVIPEEKTKPRAYTELKNTLIKLENRLPINSDFSEIKKQRSFRLVLGCVGLVLCLVSGIVSLSILLDSSYTPTFKGDFFAAHGGAADRLLTVMPWAIAAFLAAVTVSVLFGVSEKKELGILKAELVKNAKDKGEKRKAKKLSEKVYEKFPILKSEKLLLGVRIGLGIIGVTFVVWGVSNGGMADVLAKAVEICTQCIGLG